MRKRLYAAAFACSLGAVAVSATAHADNRRDRSPDWGPGELVLEGGGCPIETPDARSLMFASGRAGGAGSFDIWVIDREKIDGEWSEPKNLPAPINTAAADFCPAPLGRTFFFVSTREGGCGFSDIYMSRQSPAGDWSEPVHLPCAPHGPNTAGWERSPSFVETWHGSFLFFSSDDGNASTGDIFVSLADGQGEFSRGHRVHALSTREHGEQMPTVRARPAGGFEVTFNSDRPGTARNPAFGGQDAYWARAWFLPFWWSTPQNAGPNVNTAADETRASLSADLQRFYVGRGDIYVSERE